MVCYMNRHIFTETRSTLSCIYVYKYKYSKNSFTTQTHGVFTVYILYINFNLFLLEW